jgi:hypothetical protein
MRRRACETWSETYCSWFIIYYLCIFQFLFLLFLCKPFITFVLFHCLEKDNEFITVRAQNIAGDKYGIFTSFSKSFALGSIWESSLNASSPTKHISWPSYNLMKIFEFKAVRLDEFGLGKELLRRSLRVSFVWNWYLICT